MSPSMAVRRILRGRAADAVEAAVEKVYEDGYRTPDLFGEGMTKVNTQEMGDLVAKALLEA